MRNRLRTGAATLALLGSVALAATAAIAQTGSPSGTTAPGDATSGQAVQGPFNLTADAIESFLASLAGVDTQPAPSGFKPAVGASVPKDMKTQTMPSDAKANLPQAHQDNHMAKVDGADADDEADMILLIDPDTQQVVGMVSTDGGDGGTMGGKASSPGAAPSSGSSSGTGTPSGTSK